MPNGFIIRARGCARFIPFRFEFRKYNAAAKKKQTATRADRLCALACKILHGSVATARESAALVRCRTFLVENGARNVEGCHSTIRF